MADQDARLSPLLGAVAAAGLDAAALVPGPNFRRLFGRDFHLMERPLVVIAPREGAPVAILPNLEMASFDLLDFPGPVFDWRDEEGYKSAFAQAAAASPQLAQAQAFGLEAQRMRAFEAMALQAAFPEARFLDAHAAISGIRLRKEAREIDLMREAIRISEAALAATLEAVRVGMTETEIAGLLTRELFAQGADGLAFAPIVAAGDNAAQPHATPRAGYRIKAGDALLIDFGARLQGYNADVTRTVFVQAVSERDRAFYETVRAANEAGCAAAAPGRKAHAVDDAAQRVLEASPFAAFRRHKTGHGLGLDVHEAPQIMRGDDTVLAPGMVFTVEPGLYRLGEIGVRIEDDVAITADGAERLTQFPRELRLVG